MNNRFLAFFAASPPPPTVYIDTVTTFFDSVSNINSFPNVRHDSIVAFESRSGLSATPRVAKVGKIGISLKSSFVAAGQVYRPAPQLTEDCAFVFPFNRWNWPGSIISVTSGSAIGPYVASNTQLQQRSKVLRMSSSLGASSTHVTTRVHADLQAPYRLNSICIVSHNMTAASTFRVRISSDSAMSNLKYDSGSLPIWEPAFIHGGPYEEETQTDGTPTDDLIAMLKYCGENPRTVRWIVFDEVAARHVWIDFDDPNNSDKFTEVAYIYAGLCIRAHPDQVYGWNISPVSVARNRRSASGSVWTDVFYRQVVASATFASQPDDMALGFWSLLAQYLGKDKEFIIAFQPSDSPSKKFWFTIYGRFRQPPQIENIATGSNSVAFEVEELPG